MQNIIMNELWCQQEKYCETDLPTCMHFIVFLLLLLNIGLSMQVYLIKWIFTYMYQIPLLILSPLCDELLVVHMLLAGQHEV